MAKTAAKTRKKRTTRKPSDVTTVQDDLQDEPVETAAPSTAVQTADDAGNVKAEIPEQSNGTVAEEKKEMTEEEIKAIKAPEK